MILNEFLKYVETRELLKGDETHQLMNRMSDGARRMTFGLNGPYHALEEIRELLSCLFNKPADPFFCVFPLFYTDLGKNITIGKNVFINACCYFRDHDGVTLGDGCQIGHNVVFATLDHSLAPEDRSTVYPVPIVLGKSTWVGSNAMILFGVTIGENTIVEAGSAVTKDVPDSAVVGGVPIKAIRYIQ